MRGPLTALTDYELRHLTSHLIAAGRAAELHRLLELEQSDGRNAWFEAKSAMGGTGEYSADLAGAWSLATTAGDVPRRIRYALMTASVRSRWQRLPARLLAASVAAGMVPWTEALSIVRQIPSLSAQATAIEELAPVVPEHGLSLLLDLALTLGEQDGSIVKELAPYLPIALVRRSLPAARNHAGFQDDAAVHALILRLAALGETDEAVGLFAEHASVPLALRLAPLLDEPGRLFADDAFLATVLRAGGAVAVEPGRLASWAERVLSAPVDRSTADALLAAFPRLPGPTRDLIDPIRLCALHGVDALHGGNDVEREVRALVDLAPVLALPARKAVLDRAVALTMDAPESERHRYFPELNQDPVRARLCLITAPVLARCGDRTTALQLARIAFDTGLKPAPMFMTYGGRWLGDALVTLAAGAELDAAIQRVITTYGPGHLHRLLAVLPRAAERHRRLLVPAIQKAIGREMEKERARFLVKLLPWLPPSERAKTAGAVLAGPDFVRNGGLELPELIRQLPSDARPPLLAQVVAVARTLKPKDAATVLLGVARSAEPDLRPGLLMEAARLHRDGEQERSNTPSGAWLPFTAEELDQLDLPTVLGYYQMTGDDEEIGEYETDLLRDLGGTIDEPSERERAALAYHHAKAGDLPAALRYGPLTAEMFLLAMHSLSGPELLEHAARLDPAGRATVYLDVAHEGPLDVLENVVERARSLEDPSATGRILLAAADRAPGRADAIRWATEAWQLAVDSGVIQVQEPTGESLLWARGRWLGSAALDVLCPLLPRRARTDLLRRTVQAIPALDDFGSAVLLHLATFNDRAIRRPVLALAEGTDRLQILAAFGDTAAAMRGVRRLREGRGSAVAAIAPYLPLEQLAQARALVVGEDDPSVYGAIAQRLCILGKPDRAMALLSELPSIMQEFGQPDPREAATGDLPEVLLRHGYLPEALQALEFLPEDNAWGDTPRIDALASMAPDLVRADPDAAHDAVFALSAARVRARWLRLLAVYASAAAEDASDRLWNNALEEAASRPRAQALEVLAGIRPITRALGGLGAVKEEARSVRMVRRWWP